MKYIIAIKAKLCSNAYSMARKPNFTRKKKRKQHGETFWDSEYKNPTHLKLSTKHSEDLEKFTRWVIRRNREDVFGRKASVLDIGCGNGRNVIFLNQSFGNTGIGYDISKAAIAQAAAASRQMPIKYKARSIAGPLDVDANSQAIALDMMTSHFLNKEERHMLRDEIFNALEPGGLLFMKTFLKDEDQHTVRLLREFPGPEAGSYIHPVMGVAEYVYSEDELVAFLREKFIVRKIYRSHRHTAKGGAGKRRTISIYVERDY
jgi:SAM-dependent methyltransferase